MGRIGFDRRSGLIYEGRDAPTHPMWPTPILTQATLIESPGDFSRIPTSFDSSPFGWMFLESSFDPATRTRRGRLYQSFGNAGWETALVEAHPAASSDAHQIEIATRRVRKELSVFIECTELLLKPNRGEGLQMAMGQRGGDSLWRILQTERIASGDVMLTLRAESAFGILPKIDKSKIPLDGVKGVEIALERVLSSAYRELPQSVVDHCRNAAVMVISRWMQVITESSAPLEEDLGIWIKKLRNHFGEDKMVALRAAMETINRLHPRGKDNEANKHQLRAVEEADGELAVHCLAFIIRDIRWAA